MSFWQHLTNTIFSAEVIRPLIVAMAIGGFAAVRKIVKNTRATRVSTETTLSQLSNDMRDLRWDLTKAAQQQTEFQRETGRQFTEQAEYRAEVRERLITLDDRLTGVTKELHPNGGSSLRDAVTRLEGTAKATAENLDRHLDDAAYQVTRLDKLSDRTENN